MGSLIKEIMRRKDWCSEFKIRTRLPNRGKPEETLVVVEDPNGSFYLEACWHDNYTASVMHWRISEAEADALAKGAMNGAQNQEN